MAPKTAQKHILATLVLLGFLAQVYAQDANEFDQDLLDTGVKVNVDDDHEVQLPFSINYFGSTYDKLYISKDGLISFEQGARYYDNFVWSEGNLRDTYDRPFIAPFYHRGLLAQDPSLYSGRVYLRIIDRVDLEGNSESPTYAKDMALLYVVDNYIPDTVVNPPAQFSTELLVIVTWEDIADQTCDETNIDDCPRSTFQVLITADRWNTFVILNYNKMEIPAQPTYQSGFNGGHRRGWFNLIPCQENCANRLNNTVLNQLPSLKGSDKPGRFVLDVGHEVIVRGGCLPDGLDAGTLEVYPREVGMFGGELLRVSGHCLPKDTKIYCKFASNPGPGKDITLYKEVLGKMQTEMKGHCQVPELTWQGPTYVFVSSDDTDFGVYRTITVLHPSQVPSPVDVPKSVLGQWFSRDTQSVTAMWDPLALSDFDRAEVEVNLIGYRENEDNRQVQYQSLAQLGKASNNDGKATFRVSDFQCQENCLQFEFGLVEIKLMEAYQGTAKERIAFRLGPVPLGWYINNQLTQEKGSDWSDQRCQEWYTQDSQDKSWLNDLPACPCTLDQAMADFGRFEPDSGCNIHTGSKCDYHKGMKHCVRSIQPTSHGAGSQCCYDKDGVLHYSQFSYQGSTPDRSHVFGSRPYGRTDLVPSLSHWKHDVLPFYHCCLWNHEKLCDMYTRLRPTPDCAEYNVPGLAFIRGDPHVTTFDGVTYHFGGRGDFHLVRLATVDIQGRFEEPPTGMNPTKGTTVDGSDGVSRESGSSRLSRVAIRTTDSLVPDVLIQPAPEDAAHPRGLDVFVNNERVFFYSQLKMEFSGGLAIVNNVARGSDNKHTDFTVLLPNNVGVNVVGENRFLRATVSLPPTLQTSTGMGLMGTFDGNENNEYTASTESVVDINSFNDEIYSDFALSWSVSKESTIFKDSFLVEDYVPFHEYGEIPSDYQDAPSDDDISSTCGNNENCKWDFLLTNNRYVAMATKDADSKFLGLQRKASHKHYCGVPEVGQMAVLSSTKFVQGNTIKVTGCSNDAPFSGEAQYTCRERQSGRGHHTFYWDPEPQVACSADENGHEHSDEDDETLIIGLAAGLGGGVALLAAAICGFACYKKRKTGSGKPTAKPRQSAADEVRSPGASEAMLERGQPTERQEGDRPREQGSNV